MTRFDNLYGKWHAAGFPSTTMNDEVDELHKDLILYDSWVAESVIPFVKNGRHVPAVPDVVRTLDEFMQRAEVLAQRLGGQDLVSVQEQMAYAKCLAELYAEFLVRRSP